MLVRDEIIALLKQQGYTDEPLLEYAEEWITTNERMDIPTWRALEMLKVSRGFVQYEQYGEVPDWED